MSSHTKPEMSIINGMLNSTSSSFSPLSLLGVISINA